MKAINSQHNPLLEKMHAMAKEAKLPPNMGSIDNSAVSGFDKIYHQALNGLKDVNDLQMTAGDAAERFALGDPGISVTQLKITEMKADLAFKFTAEVRNKFISAYQDIWNMSV